jgi:hypothetical protein
MQFDMIYKQFFLYNLKFFSVVTGVLSIYLFFVFSSSVEEPYLQRAGGPRNKILYNRNCYIKKSVIVSLGKILM